MKKRLCLFAATLPLLGFALKTPETSKLFIAHTDEVSRVVSYLLKPGLLDFHHQSIYFTARCMTDDGRFLVFSTSPNEFRGKRRVTRSKAIIDFEKDEAYVLDETRGWYTPWLDVERDQMWYVNRGGVHRRDLLVDPNRDILVCPVPEPLVYAPGSSRRYGTHITLSPDRRRIFVDAQTDGVERQGVINLDTGKWEEWSQVRFCCNHGQFNPADPSMAMCAFEYAWFLTADELPPEKRGLVPMTAMPYVTETKRLRDHTYPRLWLFRNNGEKWMVPSRITNSASHEIFDWDGSGFYWCGGGVPYHDLATERQSLIMPCRASHATMTADKRYVVADDMWGNWCRGGGWRVAFWNRAEHRGVWLFNHNPPMARNKATESNLHPDPHPMFVCKDRYVVCTVIRDAGTGDVNDNYMCLAVTPVKQLAELTRAALAPIAPKYFDLAWRNDPALQGLPHELALDTKCLRRHNPSLARPAIGELGEAFTAYAVEAKVNDQWQSIPSEPIQHPYAYRDGAVLRFIPPAGTTALRLVADAPGRFEVRDAELCDNLFDRRNLHDLYPPRRVAVCKPGDKPMPAAECEVSSAAGKPVKFWLDFRNFAFRTWWGDVRLEQFDAAGRALGSVVESQFVNLELTAGTQAKLRDFGRLHPRAAKVRLFFEGMTDGNGESCLEIQQLNLRVAVRVPNEFEPQRQMPPLAVPPASGKIDFQALDACIAATKPKNLVRSGDGMAITADTRLVKSGKDTMYLSGGRPMAVDLGGHDLTLSGEGRIILSHLDVKRPGNLVVDGGLAVAIVGKCTKLNGTAANTLVCRDCSRLQFNGTRGDLGWTLDAAGLGYVESVGRDVVGPAGEVCYWQGPVKIGAKPLTVRLAEQDFSLLGPVTGAGIRLIGAPGTNRTLDLGSAENAFAGGVEVSHATLNLMKDGALPVAGGALRLKDAAVRLSARDVDYHLPDLVAEGDSSVNLGHGSWRRVEKVGKGTLHWNSLASAQVLAVKEGAVRFACDTTRSPVAGLVESERIAYADSSKLFREMAAHRVDPARVTLSAAAYYDSHHPFWITPPPDTSTVYRCAFSYTGYVWNNAATNETWTFAGAAGTHLYVDVNGRNVFRFTEPDSKSLGNATLKPGPNPIDIRGYIIPGRISQYALGGHSHQLGWDDPAFALGYDRLGRGATNRANYAKLEDPGDGSLFTWTLPEKLVDGITVPPGGKRALRRRATFGRIVFAPGTAVEFSGDAPDKAKLSGAGHLLVEATELIELPTGVKAPKGWKLELSSDHRQLYAKPE